MTDERKEFYNQKKVEILAWLDPLSELANKKEPLRSRSGIQTGR
ncbi:hypothetical protein ACFL54_07065 [Planctomycetota bacterium]